MATNGGFDRSKEGETIEKIGIEAGKKLARKLMSKLTSYIGGGVVTFLGFLGTLLLPVLLYVILPTILVMAAGSYVSNIEFYDQECPELVKAFLEEKYDEFEAEIRSLCDDEDFEAFVQSSEFDIGYTKMVYGGTSTYTDEELRGNYKGVQELKSNFVTLNEDGTYSAKSIIADIEEYQKAGVSTNDIYINDEYLTGYSSSNIEDGEAVKFDKWIKSSYYNIPMYYWYANLQTEYGYTWDYTDYKYQGNVVPFIAEEAAGSSYGEILVSEALSSREAIGKKRYNASLLPIGHKFLIEDSFLKKSMKWVMGNDSKETGTTHELLESTETDLYEWMYEKEEGEEKTNFEKYILDTKDTALMGYGEREGKTNALIDEWKDNFAEYITKELYYIYPDRQYILDYFLGDGKEAPTKDEKVAFLQRTFHAMSSGTSLEVEFKESYYVENGYIINGLNGNAVGSINIQNIEIENLQMKYAEWYVPEYKECLMCPNGQTMGKGHGYECKGYPFSDGYVYFKEELNAKKDGEGNLHYYCPECKTELTVPAAVYNNHTELFADGNTEIDFKEFEKVFNEMKNVANNPYPTKVQYSYDMVVTDTKGNKITINCTDDSADWLTIYGDDLNNGNTSQRINIGFGGVKDELSSFISNSYAWNGEYYESNTVCEDGASEEEIKNAQSAKKALDSVEFEIMNMIIQLKGFKGADIKNYKAENVKSFFNEKTTVKYDEENENNSLIALFDAKGIIKEKREAVKVEYTDTSMLNWTKTEIKEGDKIKSVTYEITMKYADISRYEEEGRYRVAYGFETEGAITEAFNLLQYAKTNKTLTGVSNHVNFDELFVRIDDETTSGEYITGNTFVEIVMEIISKNESGDYGACRNPILGTESSLTVGYMQWYGGRAYNILKSAINNNKRKAEEILSDSLYEYITEWKSENDRSLTDNELQQVKELLESEAGQKAQREQAAKDIQGYIDLFEKKGVTNAYVLAYLCDCYHQSPQGAQGRVLVKLQEQMPDYNDRGIDALVKVNEIAKNDLYTTASGNIAGLGITPTRRDRTYQMLAIFDLESSDSYGFPLDKKSAWYISSEYGMRDGVLHKGIDFAAPEQTKIYAAKSGKVIFAGEGKTGSGYGGYGYCVVIDDGKNYAIYAHMYQKPEVKTGETVEIGQYIGLVGNTGMSFGNHLHFELREGGNINKSFDPKSLISFPEDKTT